MLRNKNFYNSTNPRVYRWRRLFFFFKPGNKSTPSLSIYPHQYSTFYLKDLFVIELTNSIISAFQQSNECTASQMRHLNKPASRWNHCRWVHRHCHYLPCSVLVSFVSQCENTCNNLLLRQLSRRTERIITEVFSGPISLYNLSNIICLSTSTFDIVNSTSGCL